jgi:hypothetical protein
MENRDIDNQIAIRNAIQMEYKRFKGSSELEVKQLKELSAYPLKLVGLEITKCVKNNVQEHDVLTTLLKKLKSLSYHAPTKNERDEFYEKYQSDSSKRCLELLGSGLTYEEMKPLIFSVLETMRDEGVMRKDRPKPTDPKAQWQVQPIQSMNESDADYMERIDEYKNDHDIKLADRIPLTELQEEWLRYINCETDVRPLTVLHEKSIGLTNISSEIEIKPMDSVPF